MSRLLILGLAGLVMLSSCIKEMGLFRSNDRKFAVDDAEFTYLSSRAKFKYDNGDQKISATANFRILKDSVIWASISPGLGVELARVIITRENIRAIDKLKRDYYEFDFKKLSEIYGFEVNYDLVEAVAIGNSLFLPEKRRDVTETEAQYKYEHLEGPYGIHHYVGQASKKLEKLYAFDQTTNNSVLVNYGQFMSIEDQIMPRTIQATVNFADQKSKQPVSIEIDYNRTILQEEPLSFPFQVPDKYTRK